MLDMAIWETLFYLHVQDSYLFLLELHAYLHDHKCELDCTTVYTRGALPHTEWEDTWSQPHSDTSTRQNLKNNTSSNNHQQFSEMIHGAKLPTVQLNAKSLPKIYKILCQYLCIKTDFEMKNDLN